MLFQGGALYDYMSVEENIMFPLKCLQTKQKDENLIELTFCLERVNLSNKNDLMPSELSGGMKKRVAIARAILWDQNIFSVMNQTQVLTLKTAILIDNLIKEITLEYNITTLSILMI